MGSVEGGAGLIALSSGEFTEFCNETYTKQEHLHHRGVSNVIQMESILVA